MDEIKLEKIRKELEKARSRKASWEKKVEELEARLKEAENTCIHNMVHAAELSPEQLAKLIELAKKGRLMQEWSQEGEVLHLDPAEDESEEALE